MLDSIEVEMSSKTALAAIALWATASAANAQNCMQYPPGPDRLDCVNRNPGVLAKRERCQQEGRQMGLAARRGGGGNGGGLREYVVACMQRR